MTQPWQGANSSGGGSSSDMIAQAKGMNLNLAALVQVLTNAFVGNASQGTFIMPAAASQTVNDTNVKASSFINWAPTNADAGTLEGAATKLFVSAIVPGVSFTVSTASGGSAAGTETFSYLIANVG